MNRLIKRLPPFLLGVLLLIGLLFLPANAYSELGDLGEARSSYDRGSAGVLSGKNLIISYFMDTPSSKWTKEESLEEIEKLRIAVDYLEKSAGEYGIELSFEYDFSKTDCLKKRARIDREADQSDEFYEYLDKKIDSYGRYYTPYYQYLEKFKADNIFIIIFLKQEGRAYAICYDGVDSPRESLVAYKSSSPSVLAHEILHLYGAHDFYENAEYTLDAVEAIKNEYPEDIMITVDRDSQITKKLSELTAYQLGWVNAPRIVDEFPQLLK